MLVYRGQPSAEHDPKPYARNQAQKAYWERDGRVSVTHRPLKYRYERDVVGQLLLGVDGKRIVESKGEKGIDVLCALAVVREAQRPDVDLVILASHDSDLEPALDEALALGSAKIGTFSWYDPAQPHRIRQLRPGSGRTELEHPPWRNRVPQLLGSHEVPETAAEPISTREAGPDLWPETLSSVDRLRSAATCLTCSDVLREHTGRRKHEDHVGRSESHRSVRQQVRAAPVRANRGRKCPRRPHHPQRFVHARRPLASSSDVVPPAVASPAGLEPATHV